MVERELNARRLRLIKTGTQSPAQGRWHRTPAAAAFLISFAALLLLHAPLLGLPYFWDEAGYYIPAAHDLYSSGAVIPFSIPANPHPPLVAASLALAWKLGGFHPATTRVCMLLWAALALAGLYRLALRVSNQQVAIATLALTALYPVFFSQSVLAHLDMAAAALTLWGLDAYVAYVAASAASAEPQTPGLGPWLRYCAFFTLATLAKETAIVAPLALFVWELAALDLRRWPRLAPLMPPRPARLWQPLLLLLPAAPLAAWLAYLYSRTGHLLGDDSFVHYNLTATLSPVRFVFALLQRMWQVAGHMNLYVLAAATVLAMFFPALPELGRGVLVMPEQPPERERIALATQAAFAVVIVAYLCTLSLVGGALLTRYLLPVVPLVILICVSTLRRRVTMWPYAAAVVALGFVIALFVNPLYRFAPEDNLAWTDYVRMHQHADEVIEARYAQARVLTAWPASDELTRTYLGYVRHPLPVVRIENFTAEQIATAAARSDFEVALLFSTKYEPPGGSPLDGVAWWRQLQQRYFDYHHDLPPQLAAAVLGARVVYMESRGGQWVAIAEREGRR